MRSQLVLCQLGEHSRPYVVAHGYDGALMVCLYCGDYYGLSWADYQDWLAIQRGQPRQLRLDLEP